MQPLLSITFVCLGGAFLALMLSHQLWAVNAVSSRGSFFFGGIWSAERCVLLECQFFFLHSLILVGACLCETGSGLDSERHWDCEQLTRLACSNEYCWQSFNRDGKAFKLSCEQQP